jgi:hypothetical protein
VTVPVHGSVREAGQAIFSLTVPRLPARWLRMLSRGKGCCSTVKELVAGSGRAFDDRGQRELKGIPGEWRLYAVDIGTA